MKEKIVFITSKMWTSIGENQATKIENFKGRIPNFV
jgi:hypothetical protein